MILCTIPRMAGISFNDILIAVYRPTHKEYDFLRYGAWQRRPHQWVTIDPPALEGIHKNYQHTLIEHAGFLDFWCLGGSKRLNFQILSDILKIAGSDRIIPVIRITNGRRYHNTNIRVKKASLANVVVPAGQQVAQLNPVAPAPVVVPVPAHIVAPLPVPIRTPVIIPSNLPQSMIPHFREVARNIDTILTNNTISAQEKASQIMNKYARSIREVIRTVEHEKEIPQFVAQTVAQRSVEQGEACPITYDDITVDEAAVTSCFHVFSKDAIQMYRAGGNMTCPVCRQHCSVTNAL